MNTVLVIVVVVGHSRAASLEYLTLGRRRVTGECLIAQGGVAGKEPHTARPIIGEIFIRAVSTSTC